MAMEDQVMNAVREHMVAEVLKKMTSEDAIARMLGEALMQVMSSYSCKHAMEKVVAAALEIKARELLELDEWQTQLERTLIEAMPELLSKLAAGIPAMVRL